MQETRSGAVHRRTSDNAYLANRRIFGVAKIASGVGFAAQRMPMGARDSSPIHQIRIFDVAIRRSALMS